LFETETLSYELGPPEQGLYEPFKRIMLHSKIVPGRVKIVLIWGAQPADLDLFVVTPFAKVYHACKQDHSLECLLDSDMRSGYGPETVTLSLMDDEAYGTLLMYGASHLTKAHIYVHQHSTDSSLPSSNAVLQVITEDGVIHKSHVPSRGIGNFWDAFSVDLRDLNIEVREKITPSEPSFEVLRGNPDPQIVMSSSKELGMAMYETKPDEMTSQEKSRSVLAAHEGFISV